MYLNLEGAGANGESQGSPLRFIDGVATLSADNRVLTLALTNLRLGTSTIHLSSANPALSKQPFSHFFCQGCGATADCLVLHDACLLSNLSSAQGHSCPDDKAVNLPGEDDSLHVRRRVVVSQLPPDLSGAFDGRIDLLPMSSTVCAIRRR